MENFRTFQSFFDYKPCFLEDPLPILDDILSHASKYLTPKDLETIRETYEFTKLAHLWVIRQSGEPYIVHPLRATQFLMEINPDVVSIQACLLHDVIEDTDYTYADISEKFGWEVADICEWLAKVSKIRYNWEDRSLETLKKTFLAMAKDLRVIFVKFADRIHNIQTLQYHPTQEKKLRIAKETIKIYASLANRLWLYTYQLYLENGSFKAINPDKFAQIMEYIRKYFWNEEKIINNGTKNLYSILKKEWLSDFTISGRIKSPFRIYEKMEKKYHTDDVAMIMDLLAFRIVAWSVSDCYRILGIIHKYYTPLIKKIKDYIAVPKFNGYKSIHTTILGMFRFPVEIQIRTKIMDSIAEHGVAAHYAYSENNASVEVPFTQTEWIEKLKQLVSDYSLASSKDQFSKILQVEILDKSIFVYTPKGDLKELPSGSSVLDFAFNIHEELGLKFRSATVNNQVRPLSYILKTWDIVQINVDRSKNTAMRYWMEYLHTPSARYKLMKFIKAQDKLYHLNQNISDTHVGTAIVDVDSNVFLQYGFCKECHPEFGEKIIAQSWKEELKIHTINCKTLRKIAYKSLLEAHRSDQKVNIYSLNITLAFNPQQMSILQLISLFSAASIPVIKLEVIEWSDVKKHVKIQWEVSSPSKLWYFFSSLTSQSSTIEIIEKALS